MMSHAERSKRLEIITTAIREVKGYAVVFLDRHAYNMAGIILDAPDSNEALRRIVLAWNRSSFVRSNAGLIVATGMRARAQLETAVHA